VRKFFVLILSLTLFEAELFAQNNFPLQLNQKAERSLLSQPDSAFLYANEALQTGKELNDKLEEGNSHQLLGEIFFHQGVYLQALDHLLKAGELFYELHNEIKLASNLNQLGLVYYNIRQPEDALKNHKKALQYYEALKDKKGIAYSLGCIGRLFEKKLEYTTALTYQHRALVIYERIGDNRGIATILENIGSVYEDQGDFKLALDYFTQSLRLNEITSDSLSMIINLNNIGDNYRKTKKYELAVLFTEKALTLAKRLNDRYQVSSAYKDLSKIYHAAGDDHLAYENLEAGRTLYEEIFARDASQQLALLQTLFETEKKNNSIQQLESSQKLDTVIKLSLAAGLILIVILGAAIISRQRLKIKKDKEEIEQNKQVYQAQNKLMQSELENNLLRENQLKLDIETQSKSLTTHTLHIMGKNKMLEDIQQKLNDLLGEDHQEQRKKVKSLLKMIDHNFVHDKDWDDFRHIFAQVHKDFFEKLSQRSRELTSSDLRLAALIRLNMPSRDMAPTLGISTDSLRIARYRLKKKLELEEGDNLISFIHSL